MTKAERERYGKSKMVRYVSGIDQPIYPIAYVRNKVPAAKHLYVCSYTADGRASIHMNLNVNVKVMGKLRDMPSEGHSTEFMDSRISLFSAQQGKCAISGKEFQDASEVICWMKTPAEMGGRERYQNMVLIHYVYLPLLTEPCVSRAKDLANSLLVTKLQMNKVNILRALAGLPAIQ